MSEGQIIMSICLYPMFCGTFAIGLAMLIGEYDDKMIITNNKVKSPYPLVRWVIYAMLFLFLPIIFIIELLKVGLTKDK